MKTVYYPFAFRRMTHEILPNSIKRERNEPAEFPRQFRSISGLRVLRDAVLFKDCILLQYYTKPNLVPIYEVT